MTRKVQRQVVNVIDRWKSDSIVHLEVGSWRYLVIAAKEALTSPAPSISVHDVQLC